MKIEHFRSFIYSFIKENIDEISYKITDLGFISKLSLLKNIKRNDNDALWAFTELMSWGMNHNYSEEFIVGHLDDEFNTPVYKWDNYYFIIEYEKNKYSIKEVEYITKTIKVFQIKKQLNEKLDKSRR